MTAKGTEQKQVRTPVLEYILSNANRVGGKNLARFPLIYFTVKESKPTHRSESSSPQSVPARCGEPR